MMWWVSACTQAEGEPCQVTSDCASGLLCCPGDAASRYICSDLDVCPGSNGDGNGDGNGTGNGNGAGNEDDDGGSVDAAMSE